MKHTGVTSVVKSGTWVVFSRCVQIGIACAGLALPAISQDANPQATSDGVVVAPAPVIPQQVRYAGKLPTRSGDTVEAVFNIYAAQEGGDPLWTETQQVTVDADGDYTVLLGSMSPSGLPQSLFAGGAARWLGVSVERAPELARVPLSSVPYAMKSADAQALAGHPAGDFVTQGQLSEQFSQFAQSESERVPAPAIQPLTSGTITGSGTAGAIPEFTGANTIGNSEMTQVGTDIGINEATPAATLDVNGTGQFRGTLTLPAVGTATTSLPQRSQELQLDASAWSTTAAAAISPIFSMYVAGVGNDSPQAAGTLEFGYQVGTASPSTIMSVTSNGSFVTYGSLTSKVLGSATASAALDSPVMSLGASVYKSSTSTAEPQTFQWEVIPTGNNTATPSANLALLYGANTATPTPTGFSISPTGTINWASGQTFPITGTGGTITGITTSSPLTGTGTSGSVALGFNTSALETTLNTTYPQLNAENTFSNNNNFVGTIGSQGTLDLESTGVTSPYAPNLNSALLELSANAYNSNEGIPEALNFGWQSVATGGNTSSPSANLELLYGSGSTAPAATGLSIAPSGIITFASGQTFPGGGGGGGTITGVTAGTALTGGGNSGNVTLNVDTTKVVTGVAAGTGLTGGGTGGTPILAVDTTAVPLLSGNNVFTGPATFEGAFTFENLAMDLIPNGIASPSYASFYSPVLEQTALAYNTSLGASEPLNFGWQVTATGGNTASPSASLDLLYGANGSGPSATGLSFAPNGIITFASGQTFPGASGGTITGVTAGTDLTGGGSSGSVTLNVDTTKVVSGVTAGTGLTGGGTGGTPTLSVNSSVVPLLGELNIFSQQNQFKGGLTAYPGATSSLYGSNLVSSGIQADSGKSCIICDFAVAVLGTTDDGYGLWGEATTGTAVRGVASTGVGGSFAVNNNLGDATSDSYLAALVSYNAGSGGALQVGNSGYGTAAYISGDGGSGLLGNQLSGFAAGLWADSYGETAIIGSSDEYFGGAFFNNSSSNPTLEAINYGGGVSGLADAEGPKDLDGVFRAQGPGGVCGVSTSGDVSCTGQLKAINGVAGGSRKVETYAMQSPENWMEDFGSGKLQEGVAVVNIDPTFAETVSESADYHVFITPNADSKGLYVINKTTTSFEVRESGGGTSTLAFDYRIVAKRRGYETLRHVDVTESYNAEMKAATMARGSGVVRKSMPMAKSPLLGALGNHPRTVRPLSAPTPHRSMNRPANTPTHP